LKSRIYLRYPDIFGSTYQGTPGDTKSGGVRAMVDVARKHGMRVAVAYKMDFCCWCSLALYGTAEAMKATEADWRAGGHDVPARRPAGAWEVSVPPRDKWVDAVVKAP